MMAKSKIRMTKGFTLIELLVVISIIALLLSIILPSLRRAKESGKRAVCLNNVRSLSIAYVLYTDDNQGKLPTCAGYKAWCNVVEDPYANKPSEAPEILQIESLRNGLLYPYVNTIEIYRCPIAKKEEFRTYSLSSAMNFPVGSGVPVEWGEIISKITQVKNPSSRMLFLDDYLDDWNASWFVPATADFWWNTTPIRHGSGGNVFSFVDCHSEYKRWEDDRTIKLAELCFKEGTPDAFGKHGNAQGEQADNEDLIWAAKAQWGGIKLRQ